MFCPKGLGVSTLGALVYGTGYYIIYIRDTHDNLLNQLV